MEGQIDGKIKEERSQKLIELSSKNEMEYNQKYIEKEIEVLFEEKKGENYVGHTKNYILVHTKSSENLENKIVKGICKKAESDHLIIDTKQCNKIVTNV